MGKGAAELRNRPSRLIHGGGLLAIRTREEITRPTRSVSASRNPRVVAAATPRRSPLHLAGLRTSKGIGFLLEVMPARSRTRSDGLAGHSGCGQVEQDQVGVGPAGNDRHPAVSQNRGQLRGVALHLVGVAPEFRLQRLAQADRLRRYDLRVEAALNAWKDGGLQLPLPALLACEDHAAAGTPEGLGSGCGDDIGVRYRRRVRATRHEAGEVRHVHHETGADLVRGTGEPLEIQSLADKTIRRQSGAAASPPGPSLRPRRSRSCRFRVRPRSGGPRTSGLTGSNAARGSSGRRPRGRD